MCLGQSVTHVPDPAGPSTAAIFSQCTPVQAAIPQPVDFHRDKIS
jgi:hypothetical protein